MGACRRWEPAADGSLPQMGACRIWEPAAEGSVLQDAGTFQGFYVQSLTEKVAQDMSWRP
jgi:hypothetical protein